MNPPREYFIDTVSMKAHDSHEKLKPGMIRVIEASAYDEVLLGLKRIKKTDDEIIVFLKQSVDLLIKTIEDIRGHLSGRVGKDGQEGSSFKS